METVKLAVVGAHLEGMPLHWQLASRQARFVAATDEGDGPLEGGEFTRATEARSSADLLRRPVRRAG